MLASKLYFYHSVMNSGKSAHIIMQIYNLREQGKNVIVFKPDVDTRDHGVIRSRALDTEIDAIIISEELNTFVYTLKIQEETGKNIDYIFVDEVNFLTPSQVETLSHIVDVMDIPVFCYGLMTDYKSRLFDGSKRMVELADSIRELKSPCNKCDNKATMHLRKVNGVYVTEGNSIQVGDTDTYESVCRTCYLIAIINS